ncbi:hypothetical protein Fot_06261 [Forsythia ovata]|uniref:Uncharacterized protein n=1 Tax=Forsythia ovata TaxID=205694 RepID=A0ABD1WSG7_9LAMI
MPEICRGRPRVNTLALPPQMAVEPPQPQFTTIQQFAALEDQMATILTALHRVVVSPQPTVETHQVEATPTLKMAHPSHQPTLTNFEDLLNKKLKRQLLIG